MNQQIFKEGRSASAFMNMDIVSLVLSVFGSTTALVSLYFSCFKVGQLFVLPLRIYILQPLNAQDKRLVQLVTSLTFLNDGAVTRAINDLRIRVQVSGKKDLILDWMHEYNEISLIKDVGAGNFPIQPTLKAYESMNKIYGFQSTVEGSEAVDVMEKEEEAKSYPAFVEYRTEYGTFEVLRKFNFVYNGRRRWELNYNTING